MHDEFVMQYAPPQPVAKPPSAADPGPLSHVGRWMRNQGWTPFEFQQRTWQAIAEGKSGLVHAPTGVGKSYAAWLGLLEARLDRGPFDPKKPEPLQALWITPLRALANDLLVSLERPLRELEIPWTVGLRTGDVSASVRKKQTERMPAALVTTPESLSLLLSRPESYSWFANLQAIVVDEWHELLGTKRGIQVELALSRLRKLSPNFRVWGLSATLGNLPEAMSVLLGPQHASRGVLIEGRSSKQIEIATLLPESMERFPWSGHLGRRQLQGVIAAIDDAKTTLIFTNTRSQAEIWFREILHARPQWAAEIAVHHGSLDRKLREYVEERTRRGTMRAVVCTSSLDLGVDFAPVDQVIQIGSPKGVARLLQRAGRSGHQPGAVSRVLCVPTNALELVEYSAAREAMHDRQLEGRRPIERPIDALVQHVVTMSLADGFRPDELYDEVRSTHAFADLTRDEWNWALDFAGRGGESLHAYPQYHRLQEVDGRLVPTSPRVARLHRMNIGTIASDASMRVKFLTGPTLGTIEESFIARLKPGDAFIFAGRPLTFVRARDLVAYVRKAAKLSGNIPRWDGGRLPISTQLSSAVRNGLTSAAAGNFNTPELAHVKPVLDLQAAWSRLPENGKLLIESIRIQRNHQLYLFPFEGQLVHEGLGTLLAYRMSRESPRTITVTTNDYGLELLSPQPLDATPERWREWLSPQNLIDDLLSALNASELARRKFREIARIAGLVLTNYPGAPASMKQLQASAGLIFDVFREYDPGNLLLLQARREVLDDQLEVGRLLTTLRRIETLDLTLTAPPRLTPLAFPLWASRIQKTQLSTERWSERISRMVVQLEKAADETERPPKVRKKHANS